MDASTTANTREPAHWPGILLNGFLFFSNVGWLVVWGLVTFGYGVLTNVSFSRDFAPRPLVQNAHELEGLAALGGIPVLLGVLCALIGVVLAIQGQRARGLWAALAAFVLGSVPGVVMLITLIRLLA